MYPIVHFEWNHVAYELPVYPLFVIISMLLGFILFLYQLRHAIRSIYLRITLFLCIAMGFLVGARVFNFFIRFPDASLWTLEFRNFSLYGGILGSMITSYVLFKKQRLDLWSTYDDLTIPFLICFSIMKIGCFLNGCCYGKLTTSFFRVPLPVREAEKFYALSDGLPFFNASDYGVFPTQLMESGASLLIILLLLYFKKRFPGFRFLMGCILFTTARWIILYFRLLPYPDFITNIFYPLLYATLIVLGTGMILDKKKKSAES